MRRLWPTLLLGPLLLAACSSGSNGEPAPPAPASSLGSPALGVGSPDTAGNPAGTTAAAAASGSPVDATGSNDLSSSGPAGGPVPNGFQPVEVTFDSVDHGWALGDAPCGSPPCTSVVRTRDRGRTWTGIPAPKAYLPHAGVSASPPAGAPVVHDIRFADERDGYAFGDTLFTTHDGGATWRQLQLPGKVIALEPGDGTALAVVASGGQGTLMTSPVDHDDFQPVPVLGSPLPGGSLTTIARHGRSSYVVSTRLTQNGKAAAYLANIDGAGWQQRSLPDACTDQRRHPSSIAASGDTNLVLICADDEIATETQGKLAYVTSDGGDSWSRVPDPPAPAPLDGNTAATTQGTFLATVFGIRVTRDGGKSWPFVYGSEQDVIPIVYVGFTDTDHGIALASPSNRPRQLLLSGDAGASWHPVTFS